jgi:hypothetical protein
MFSELKNGVGLQTLKITAAKRMAVDQPKSLLTKAKTWKKKKRQTNRRVNKINMKNSLSYDEPTPCKTGERLRLGSTWLDSRREVQIGHFTVQNRHLEE